jgi:multidrug efflux pump
MFQIHPDFRAGRIEFRAPGSEWWVQLSGAVVWGLGFATLLTLVLTPVMLAAPKVYSKRFVRLRNWATRGRRPARRPQPASLSDDDLPRAAE